MSVTTRRPASFASTRAFEDLPHGCRCGARWAGYRTMHCAACHGFTFTGETAFLAHRSGGRCRPPVEVGLSLVGGRAYEVWGRTGEESP